MKKVISVRFKDNGKTYYFDPADTPIQTGDYVIAVSYTHLTLPTKLEV